jgi:hypothetical protein
MKAKKSKLRVFKLRSGEEIIAKVVARPRGKFTLERPMKMNYSVVADPFTGMKKSVLYFTDWLGGAIELKIDIPREFILLDLTPDPDMEKLYDTQSHAQDQFKAAGLEKLEPDLDSQCLQPTEEELKRLDELLESMGISKGNDSPNKKFPEDANAPNPPKPTKPPVPSPVFPPVFPPYPKGILFSFSVPNDILNEWLESGIIDYFKDCFEDFMDIEMMDTMMKPKKKKPHTPKKHKPSKGKDEWKPPTGDRAKSNDYGNKIDDWSPFLKDYLSGATGENLEDGA